MPSRGNNGYIGGVEPRDTANSAKAVFNSREHAYCVATGDVGIPEDLDYTDTTYVRPSSGGGYGAVATVALTNGNVTAFRVTNGGSGYTTVPTVTFTGGGGTGAEAFATRNASNVIIAVEPWYQLYAVDIVYGGEGYTSAPTITISAPSGAGGTTATVTSTTITNGVLTGITFGTTGTRYTAQPTFTISTSGSTYPAQVVARLRCGSGYTSAPTIGFTGGGGTNAAATAYILADLGTVTVSNGGSGYTTAPTVIIPGVNLSASVTAAVTSGAVSSITITGCTNKFTEAPEIIIGGWPSLPSVSNGDQKLVGAFAIFNTDSNFVAFTCLGNYTVDWGDGTSNNYNSNVTAYKQYNATVYAGLTTQSVFKDYKVVIITITPQAGANLTTINLDVKHNQASLANYRGGWLDIRVAGQNITSLTIGSFSNANAPTLLEQFEWVGTTSASLTSWQYLLSNCYALRNIISLPGTAPTNVNYAFQNSALRYIPDFNTSAITTMVSSFSGCRNLIRIPTITSTSITSLSTAFYLCHNLRYAPIKIGSSVTNISSVFAECHRLIRLPPMDTSNVTTTASAFSACSSLVEVPDLDLRKCTNTSNMFASCRRIKSVGYLKTPAATTMNGMFNGCFNLESVKFLDTGKATNLSQLFQDCFALESIPTIDCSSATNITNIFYNCMALKSFPIINSTSAVNNGNGLYQIFYGCRSLVDAPFIDVTRADSISSLFGDCVSLENVPQISYIKGTTGINFGSSLHNLRVMPKIVAPNLTSLNSMFFTAGINYMSGFTLNATLTDVNQAFFGCSSLQKLPVLDLSGVTSAPTTWLANTSMRLGYTTGMRYGHSYSSCILSATELNTIYTNLGTAVGAQTINVTNNWGTATDDATIATNKGWTVSG